MTALCPGGGASGPKAGYSDRIIVGTAAIGAALNNVPVGYAIPFAGLLTALSLDLQGMCTTDPPTQPTMSVGDWLALAGPPGLAEFTGAQAKFTDWVRYFLWFQFCECKAAATPGPTIPAPPASVPQINPSFPGFPGTSTPCIPKTFIADLFWNSTQSTSTGAYKAPFLLGATTLVMDCQAANQSDATPQDQTWVFTIGSVSRQTIRTVTVHVKHETTVTTAIPVELFEDSVSLAVSVPLAGGGRDALWSATSYCGGVLPGVSQPCCPPDPSTQDRLDQILALVTLIQRQHVPFAYVPGTAHAGLHDQGTLTVQGLIGIKIALTTVPTTIGSTVGSPTYFYDLGWVSVLTGDGLIDEKRVTSPSQAWFSELMSTATTVGYSFAPGVVATITELAREP